MILALGARGPGLKCMFTITKNAQGNNDYKKFQSSKARDLKRTTKDAYRHGGNATKRSIMKGLQLFALKSLMNCLLLTDNDSLKESLTFLLGE